MGLDIGLSKAGLHVVIGQDFEPACVETMKANGHKVLGGDIRNIEPETMLQLSTQRRTIFNLRGTTLPTIFYSREEVGNK